MDNIGSLTAPSTPPFCPLFAPFLPTFCLLFAPLLPPFCLLFAPFFHPFCPFCPVILACVPTLPPFCTLFAPFMHPFCTIFVLFPRYLFLIILIVSRIFLSIYSFLIFCYSTFQHVLHLNLVKLVSAWKQDKNGTKRVQKRGKKVAKRVQKGGKKGATWEHMLK